MASHVRPQAIRLAVAVVVLLTLGIGGWIAWQRYQERYTVTTEPDSGQAVTRIITARLSGASALKVASLSGTLQTKSGAKPSRFLVIRTCPIPSAIELPSIAISPRV